MLMNVTRHAAQVTTNYLMKFQESQSNLDAVIRELRIQKRKAKNRKKHPKNI